MELSLEKKASSKESAQEMQVEVTKERKNNLLIACSSVLAAVCLFATQRFFPPDSLSLLRAMEAESTPLIAVQTNGKPTVVDFYADWCGYCKTMAPSMRTVEKEFAGRVNFVTVNGADPKNADLVYKFKVDGIPHIAFMDGEGYVETAFVGLVPKDVLEEEVDALAKHKALPYEGYDAFQGRPRSVFPLI
uniref:Thioredoxin domain-containing protein n=1 Tax=Fibrocapsa japonica TaxID=94617 RepID=A0A7S2V5P4_9STRA